MIQCKLYYKFERACLKLYYLKAWPLDLQAERTLCQVGNNQYQNMNMFVVNFVTKSHK